MRKYFHDVETLRNQSFLSKSFINTAPYAPVSKIAFHFSMKYASACFVEKPCL